MSVTISNEPSVLRIDHTGTIRIGRGRVTLDSLLAAFCQGATAEQIAHSYPSLDLAEIYAAIAYYLHHRGEIDQYLNQRQQSAEELRREQPQLYPRGVRERLLARTKSTGNP